MEKRKTPSHRIRQLIRKNSPGFHPKSLNYKWFLLANIMLGTFMAVLDATIVNVGLPKIMASFGVGLDKIEWVITAYMLAMAVMLPTSGWLADKFGYKRMYFYGLFLFTLGSMLCGMSSNEDMLIISRGYYYKGISSKSKRCCSWILGNIRSCVRIVWTPYWRFPD
jgi:DHA2 family multidrug resistance protein